MSSNWTNFRDNLLNNLKFDEVDEALKQSLIVLPYIIYGGLWLIEQTINKTIKEIKEM